MIIQPPAPAARSETKQTEIDDIVRSGPRGAIVVAGIATAVVMGLWFAFYFFVFLPRGPLQ